MLKSVVHPKPKRNDRKSATYLNHRVPKRNSILFILGGLTTVRTRYLENIIKYDGDYHQTEYPLSITYYRTSSWPSSTAHFIVSENENPMEHRRNTICYRGYSQRQYAFRQRNTCESTPARPAYTYP